MPDAAVDGRPEASLTCSAATEGRAGYAVYDPVGQKIGSAEEVFVNRDGEPVYIRVRMGLLWRKRTVLVPVQFVETDEERKILVLK
jgi:hypothetical protein